MPLHLGLSPTAAKLAASGTPTAANSAAMTDAGDRKQLRKAGRREAQAAKMAAKADDEATYFWECARRAAANSGARPPPPSAAASLGTFLGSSAKVFR